MKKHLLIAMLCGVMVAGCKTTSQPGKSTDCRERITGQATARFKFDGKSKAKADWKSKAANIAPGYSLWKNAYGKQQIENKTGKGAQKWTAFAIAEPCAKP